MSFDDFVDYYELLQVSSNADIEAIDRLFRHLAKKFHPDNPKFSNKELFLQISEAHQILSDPVARAGYDVKYQEYWNNKWRLASEASQMPMPCADKITRGRILSLLYVQRRRNMKSPGLGEIEMVRLLNAPLELVEFHLWYLKAKGWVERIESGHLAISALGVDEAEKSDSIPGFDNLIEDQHSSAKEGVEDQENVNSPPKASNQ